MATIEVTDAALRNIENMQKRCWDIENKYGADSSEALKATWSYLRVLRVIFQWPGRVTAEDDLSLLIDGQITIGIIWHPLKFKMPGGEWEVDPLLGEWSSHS